MRGLRRLSFPWSLCYWWLLPSPHCIDLRPMRRDSCAIASSSSFPLLPKSFTFAPLLLLFIDSDLGLDHDCAFGYYAWTFGYLMMSYLYLCILYRWRWYLLWSVLFGVWGSIQPLAVIWFDVSADLLLLLRSLDWWSAFSLVLPISAPRGTWDSILDISQGSHARTYRSLRYSGAFGRSSFLMLSPFLPV